MKSEVIVWIAALAVVSGMLVVGLLRLRWERFITLWGFLGPLLIGILSSGGVYQFRQGQVTQAQSEAKAAAGQLETVQARAERAGAERDNVTAAAQDVLNQSQALRHPGQKGPSYPDLDINAAWKRFEASESRLREALQAVAGAPDEPATTPPDVSDKKPQ